MRIAVQLPLASLATSLAAAHRRKEQTGEHKQGGIADLWVEKLINFRWVASSVVSLPGD